MYTKEIMDVLIDISNKDVVPVCSIDIPSGNDYSR